MRQLYLNPAQIITVNTNGLNYKRGGEMSNISPISGYSIVAENGMIKDFIPSSSAYKSSFDETIDLAGKIILPGFTDCHTHLVFAGSRAGELCKRLQGKTYEEIAATGGGINSTVTAVRNASKEHLFNSAGDNIKLLISQGVTSLEIKSGYGLDFENEIKILEVIKSLQQHFPIDIMPTFLGAHTFPTEYTNDHSGYLDIIINKLLPYVTQNKLAEFCDAFCEASAFSAEETEKVFYAAAKLGIKIKLHSEQFNNLGGIDAGFKYKAASIDHLEVIKSTDIAKFTDSETVAVLLPGVSFFLDYDFAPARKLIDNNAIVALASDFNPGSCHINNLSLIVGLAALKMRLTTEEIISAFTINAAKAIGIQDKTGSIEPGKQADFAVFNAEDFSELLYNMGSNLNYMTVKKGQTIYKAIDK
jgi:imidazolonepropionase